MAKRAARKQDSEEKQYDFFTELLSLENENSIDQDLLIEKISTAMLKAAQKAYPRAEDDDIRVEIHPDEKKFQIFMKKSVVDWQPKTDYEVGFEEARQYDPLCELGDLVECPIDPKRFGRSVAQIAQQSIRSDLRAINREQMLEKFQSKEQQIITVTVTQIDPVRGTVTVKYDHTELYLSRNDQICTEVIVDGQPEKVYETFTEGQVLKVYITRIANREKKPVVRISRVDPGFVEKLFEQAIPEIAEGIVKIHAVSREAGYRSKIAVSSSDPNIDAIGTCIGPHSSRINTVLKELGGEKIDLIPYSEVPEEFIMAALAPAKAISATIVTDDEEVPTAEVIVPNDQLSLAIGNKGQNAKLAAKLTGCKIDIKPQFPVLQEDDEDLESSEDFGEVAEIS